MADNPSIVNDFSGNNYNIGEGIKGGLVDAQMAYLENLTNLVQKRPMNQQQYFPGYDQGLAVGNVSGSVIGNQPIFATGGGLIPFAILDEMDRAKSEAQAKYYEQIKKELDDPLFDQKIVAADPFMQPEFSQKVMDITDKYLEIYTQRLGGDVAKAYIATKYDKNFQKEIQTMANYANMYKSVYDEVMSIKKAEVEDPMTVSKDALKAANDFIHNHDVIKDFSPDTLEGIMKKTVKTFSVLKLAESLTKGMQDTIKDNARTYMKGGRKITESFKQTNKGVAEEIINNALKAHPELKDDPDRLEVFKRAVRNGVDSSVSSAISDIDEEMAKRNIELRKNGITFDDKGNMQFSVRPAAIVDARGTKAVSYPTQVRPASSYVGMTGYIRHNGKLVQVKFPESYDMSMVSEYNIQESYKSIGLVPDRYVEVRLDVQSTQPYTPEIYRTAKGMPITMGEGKAGTQTVPSTLQVLNSPDPSETLDMIGPTTVLVPFDELKTMVEANIPYMKDVHDELEKQPSRESAFLPNTSSKEPPVQVDVIPITSDTSVDDIDPNKSYTYNHKRYKGQEIIDLYNSKNKK